MLKIITFLVISFILLVTPLVFAFVGVVDCDACGLGALGYIFIAPIILLGEIIAFFIIKKIFNKQLKSAGIALLTSVVTFVIIFFLSPVFPSAVAKASSNVSFCKAIFYSEIAFDDCIYDTAIKFKKVEFCGKMKARWNRDRCYNYMASVTEDKSLCGKIELELMRNKCY